MTIDTAIRVPDPRAATASPGTAADRQVVVCVVAGERYGIDVGHVLEIIRLPPITPLPGASTFFTGVINLRGRIIPVMDLRERFALPSTPPTRFSRIVVAHSAGIQVGLVVDAVEEVVLLAASAIEPTPALTTRAGSDHLTGIARANDQLIILLDLDPLVAAAAQPTDVRAPEPSA